jgi:hypothetical protein
MMSTSFAVPEWDSEDDDDTNSSEEFMYVKGSSLQQATTNAIDEEKGKLPTWVIRLQLNVVFLFLCRRRYYTRRTYEQYQRYENCSYKNDR